MTGVSGAASAAGSTKSCTAANRGCVRLGAAADAVEFPDSGLAEAVVEGAIKCCHIPIASPAPRKAENVQSQTVFFIR
jgi:hypothetical protein